MNELIETLRGMADMLDGPQNAGSLVVPSIIRRFREAADTIERLETENTALHKQLDEKDEKIKQWEITLSTFDDGVDPTQDVLDLLSNTDELKKWIARAAWHCRKASEMNGEIEGLNAAVERRDRMLADQSKALSDLQGRFDIINNFEQSQCAKPLVKIAERDKALARVTAERDAAIQTVFKYVRCRECKHYDDSSDPWWCLKHDRQAYPGDGCSTPEWRGLKEDGEVYQ